MIIGAAQTHLQPCLVVDRARSSADNLPKLAETRLQWITRGTATWTEAQESLAQAQPATLSPSAGGVAFAQRAVDVWRRGAPLEPPLCHTAPAA